MSVQAKGVVELADEFLASEFESKAGNMFRFGAAVSKSMSVTTAMKKVKHTEYCRVSCKWKENT